MEFIILKTNIININTPIDHRRQGFPKKDHELLYVPPEVNSKKY